MAKTCRKLCDNTGRLITKILTDTQLKRYLNGNWSDKAKLIEGAAGLTIEHRTQLWHFNMMVHGKRHHHTLGYYPDVSLQDAKTKAVNIRAAILRGEPYTSALNHGTNEKPSTPTIHDLFPQYLRFRLSTLLEQRTNKAPAKAIRRMEYQYQKFIAPVIGNLQPMEIANRHIITILSSITDSETTRTKTQAVLSLLLQWLVTQNYIDVDESRINWQLIRKALPPCTSTSKNYPRMAIEDVPRFVALALSPQETDYDTITGIAAVLLLLTAQRAGNFLEMDSQPTGEASGWFSKWRDIDLQRRVWTIPPECLKISRSANNRQVRPLRIPLAEQTVDVLMLIRKFWRRRGIELGPDDFVVPKFDDFSRPHKSCSVRLFIQRVHQADLDSGGKGFFDPEQPGRIATTHGFRSDFEDWCISQDYSSLYADKALAHELPNKVQKAYQRNDFLEERRPMMTAWASYCASQISKGS